MAKLVCVVDVKEKHKTLDMMPIVNEVLDVFPKDLPRVPPSRAIDFVIELESGTGPISKVAYLMAPIELQELKVQLQDLLDQVFICPGIHPWRALVLFV